MPGLKGSIAAFVILASTAVSGTAMADWFSGATASADLVAGGKKWAVLMVESDKGFESVTFLPAGQTAEEASETLTFTTVKESVPSSAYDAQAAIDQNNNNANTTHYTSRVNPEENSVNTRGLYVTVPERTYSQIFSLKGTYLADGKTFLAVNYRVNILPKSELARKPSPALDILDSRVAKIPFKQIENWFKFLHDKAKQKFATKKTARAPQS